eukprot:11070604-Heterocapsa_arctica.AAC.1
MYVLWRSHFGSAGPSALPKISAGSARAQCLHGGARAEDPAARGARDRGAREGLPSRWPGAPAAPG